MNASPPPNVSPNRLIREPSPYLRQHAFNPVDWHPWGAEALGRSRAEDQPIFLSIGYSACHWCHVMERESFADAEIAAYLNAHFICIKVDREERPDLDAYYMQAVQMLTGGGGWPLSVFLTPDLQPFFGGTYFAPDERYGRISFPMLLRRIHGAWADRRAELAARAHELTAALASRIESRPSPGGRPGRDLPDRAVAELLAAFDPVRGGFGGAPKFPNSAAIGLLLRRHARTGDAALLHAAVHTLAAMARGGLFDHVGGGFHRYSVDAEWRVPHFEKMLYDQALLVPAYLDASLAAGQPLLTRPARATLDYVLRDLRIPEGGFCSSEDADSEGAEGRFYVWTRQEVCATLGPEEGPWFCGLFGVTEPGDFEGRNVLRADADSATVAGPPAASPGEWEMRLNEARARLYARREQRIRPARDDKIVAAWNGLMVSAFARGAQVLGDVRYAAAALDAAVFLRDRMICDGQLHRTWMEGRLGPLGFLDDHACAIQGWLDLYETTFDAAWLRLAGEWADRMLARFWDAEGGSFHATAADHGDFSVRLRDTHDGAEPAGVSVAALVLQRLAWLLDRRDFLEKAEACLRAHKYALKQVPQGWLNLLWAVDFHLGPVWQIVIAGDWKDPAAQRLLAAIRRIHLPAKVVAWSDDKSSDGFAIPLASGKPPVAGQSAAYVCKDTTCFAPVSTPEDLLRLLGSG